MVPPAARPVHAAFFSSASLTEGLCWMLRAASAIHKLFTNALLTFLTDWVK